MGHFHVIFPNQPTWTTWNCWCMLPDNEKKNVIGLLANFFKIELSSVWDIAAWFTWFQTQFPDDIMSDVMSWDWNKACNLQPFSCCSFKKVWDWRSTDDPLLGPDLPTSTLLPPPLLDPTTSPTFCIQAVVWPGLLDKLLQVAATPVRMPQECWAGSMQSKAQQAQTMH